MKLVFKAFETIKNAPTIYVGCGSDIYTRYSFEINIIENALIALDIIRSRFVDIHSLFQCNSYEEYNLNKSNECLLNEFEFNFIKGELNYVDC